MPRKGLPFRWGIPPRTKERIMKKISMIGCAAAIAVGIAAPASAATTDPEVIIYRFPGVLDNGSNVATLFHCTNFSGVNENIRFVTRRSAAPFEIASNSTSFISHLGTLILGTHAISASYSSGNLTTGSVQGTTAIAATSTNIICTAMVIDGSTAVPIGVALRGIRFNPV